MKIINTILAFIGIIYPFVIFFLNKYTWFLLLLFSIFWMIKFLINNNEHKYNENIEKENDVKLIIQSYFSILHNKYIYLFLSVMFFLLFISKYYDSIFGIFIYFYPSLMYILMFLVFITSIKVKPIIEVLAELEHKIRCLKPLNEKEKKYTYILTYIWSIFFIVSAIICIILAFIENKVYWTYYSGIINYIILGFLFFGERLFRKLFIKLIR